MFLGSCAGMRGLNSLGADCAAELQFVVSLPAQL